MFLKTEPDSQHSQAANEMFETIVATNIRNINKQRKQRHAKCSFKGSIIHIQIAKLHLVIRALKKGLQLSVMHYLQYCRSITGAPI